MHERTLFHSKNILCPIHVNTNDAPEKKDYFNDNNDPIINYFVVDHWNFAKSDEDVFQIEISDHKAEKYNNHHQLNATSEYKSRRYYQ